MIVIRCHECNRRYNWAGDAFCPHCGAFNQAKDYSFDRERVEVKLEDSDEETTLFRRKKTATGHANNAPEHTFQGRKPGQGAHHGNSSAQKQENNPAQASGCLKKIVIAVVVWNVGMAVLGVFSNVLFSLF